MTERLHFHFSLSCIGEGNGNPLQCSCLENPRDGGAWWAAVYGVTQSRTRLKRLSRRSSSICIFIYIYGEREIHTLYILNIIFMHANLKRSNKQKQKKSLFEHQGEQLLSH